MRTAVDDLWLEFNNKTQIASLSQGIDFLGWHLYLTETGRVVKRLRQSAKRRMLKRARSLNDLPLEACDEVLDSYLAHLAHGDTAGLTRVIKNVVD